MRRWLWRRRRRVLRLAFIAVGLAMISIVKDYFLLGIEKKPPPKDQVNLVQRLQGLNAEKERLRDLLSQVKMTCKVAKNVGPSDQALPICVKSRTNEVLSNNFTLITLESYNFKFERHVMKLWKDAEIVTISSETSSFPAFIVPVVTQSIAEREKLISQLEVALGNVSEDNANILKLGNFGVNYIKPRLLRTLINQNLLTNIQQLHIFLRLKNSHDLLFRWYETLVLLRLKEDFYLYHVSTNIKNCFDDLSKSPCVLITSWMRQPNKNSIFPETSADQATVVFKLLTRNQTTCPSLTFIPHTNNDLQYNANLTSFHPSRWFACTSHWSKPCVAYSAKFSSSLDLENVLLRFGCEVHVFNPLLPSKKSNKALFYHPWGFTADTTITNHQYRGAYRKFSATLRQLGQKNIDILYLSLLGGEWDVIKEMLVSNTIQRVNQIIATIHVWFGEEFYNHIGQYSTLQQLAEFGFEIFFVEPMLDMSNIKNPNVSAQQTKCCYTVGWIRTDVQID